MTRRLGWLAAAVALAAAGIVTYRAAETRAQPGPVRPIAAVEPAPPDGPERDALRLIREGRRRSATTRSGTRRSGAAPSTYTGRSSARSSAASARA